MLDIPEELAAIVQTKAVVVAVEALGHDPIRAAGALLLELPTLRTRVRPGRSNVFRLRYGRRAPDDAWTFMSAVAAQRGVDVEALWRTVKVTDAEMLEPVLA
jgi:hypothetical protein